MEKLFPRIECPVDLQAFKESLFYSKRTMKALRDYELVLAKKKYDDIVSSYLSKDGYLPTIIELTEKLNRDDLSKEEQEKTFQALLLLCSEPELFFGKNDGCENDTDILINRAKNFEKSIRNFEEAWSAFNYEFQVCRHYIRRGSTDLDREFAGKDRLEPDKKDQLKNALNYVYKAYFYELQEQNGKISSPPQINDRLLTHCYNKPWLLPLAHVILIRDAQLQMMGRKKFKKASLLDGSWPAFGSGNSPSNENIYIWNMITYKYAGRIQDELIRALSGTCKFEYEPVFTKFADKAYEEQKLRLQKRKDEWQKDGSRISQFYLAATVFAHNDLLDEYEKRISKIKKNAPASFCVPVCHIEEFAIRIAIKLHLDAEQLDILVKMLPQFIWDNISFASWLEKAVKFIGRLPISTTNDLEQLLSALKSLLNPWEYLSEKSDEDLSRKLLKAAKILDNESDSQNTRGNADLLWRVFKKTIYFQDLTCPALLLSGAVCISYCPEEILPDMIDSYVGKLSRYLHKCQGKDFIRKQLGIQNSSDKRGLSPKTRYIKMDIEKQPFYDELMQKIEKLIIGADSISSIEELNLEMVEKFWRQSKFSPARQTTTCMTELLEPVKETATKQYQGVIKNLSSDQEAIICLKAYSTVIKKSVAVIENSVLEILLKKAIQFVNPSGVEYKVEGGDSQ